MAFLSEISKCLAEKKDAILLTAFKNLEGEYKLRIFNDNFDVTGKDLGTPPAVKDASKRTGAYGKQYAKFREQKNLFINKKTLRVRKSGGLISRIIVGENGDDIVFGFADDKARLIAEGQEMQTQKNIFGISDEERKNVLKQISNEILNEISKCLKKA